MRLETLVDAAARVRRRGKRLDKLAVLGELLSSLEPDDIEIAASFLSGELPNGRIGVGYAMVRQVLAEESAAADAIRGDALTLEDVARTFRDIAATSGAGSQQRRRALLLDLFARASSDERDFLARLLLGELRQGALEGILIDALARATGIELDRIRRAAMISGDTRQVAIAALTSGVEALDGFRVEVFRPLQPMLAQPAESLSEARARALGGLPVVVNSDQESPDDDPENGWSGLALELKIDGARVQVHRRGDQVRVFSRQLNEVTDSVPEIVDLARALPCREIILDGEAYAVRADGLPHPFQATMRRFGRRLDVARLRKQLPLEVRFFDGLYLDGEELIDLPLAERWRRIATILPEPTHIPRLAPDRPAQAERFLRQALDSGHEGVVVKVLSSTYEAGRRGASWLKVKPSHTLDLVVLAVEWGSGRRRGKLSNLHLGARDERTGDFVMLGKTFKGLTDAMLAWQTERLLELEIREPGDPDEKHRHVVSVRPELVIEIAFNNIQASPQYPAGMALRFARVKQYREDKSAAQASTIDEVRAIFEREAAGTSDSP